MRRRAVVVLAFVVMSCSKSSEPGSCHREHDNACVEYGPGEAAAGKRLCAGMKWTPGETSCPTTNRLGKCTRASSSEWLYSGAPNRYTAATARRWCEQDGRVFTEF